MIGEFIKIIGFGIFIVGLIKSNYIVVFVALILIGGGIFMKRKIK
jgi:hypothetical protein